MPEQPSVIIFGRPRCGCGRLWPEHEGVSANGREINITLVYVNQVLYAAACEPPESRVPDEPARVRAEKPRIALDDRVSEGAGEARAEHGGTIAPDRQRDVTG